MSEKAEKGMGEKLSLPPSFAQFTSLTLLDLSFNRITEAPVVLQHLKLKELNLSHNQITRFPYYLCSHISIIDLSHNPLRKGSGVTTIVESKNMKGFDTKDVKCHRVGICVIGGPKSGKKSILRSLQGGLPGQIELMEMDRSDNCDSQEYKITSTVLNFKTKKGKTILEAATSPSKK